MSPYKFKDDGGHVIKPKLRKIYFIIGCLIMLRPLVSFVLFGTIDVIDWFNLVLGGVMIWGINFNGFYKIARWYMERKLRRFDNSWRH